MKRILIFSSEFPPGPGGIGAHAYHVAGFLSQLQWQVSVLVKQDYASQEEILNFNQRLPFDIEQLPRVSSLPLQIIKRLGRLSNLLRRFQPHIVMASGESAVWLTALLTQLPTYRHLKWAAVWHGMTPTQAGLRAFSRWAYQQPEVVISVSHYGLERLREMGVQPRFSQVIHNGVDPELFFPLPDAETMAFRRRHSPLAAQILLTVGHVSQRKGQEVVIRALPKILKNCPLVHYWMIGLPTQQRELEKLAYELGVSTHVHFLGKKSQADLLAAYNACDLFVMTSRHSQDGQFEGYGIAVVEAALCSKPSIVSDNSGLVEAVLPGETGLVVQENDPESTAQAVVQLLENTPLRMRMGEKARQRALAEQTWAIRIIQYDQELQRVVAGTQTSGDDHS